MTENMVLDAYYDRPILPKGIQSWIGEPPEEATPNASSRSSTSGRRVSTIRSSSNLSGGNQQKVIVAREFDRDVTFVVASQPTRGIDVGSIEYIHSRIVEERDHGAAVLIVSSELEEIMALSDRIIVMFEGRVAGEFDGSATRTEIGLAMLGSGSEELAS